MRLIWRVFSAILLLAMVGSAATQEGPKVKKFLTKPLVIEDQGSFFIGGVPKVTNYATVVPLRALPIKRRFPIRSRSVRCTFSSRYRKARSACPL